MRPSPGAAVGGVRCGLLMPGSKTCGRRLGSNPVRGPERNLVRPRAQLQVDRAAKGVVEDVGEGAFDAVLAVDDDERRRSPSNRSRSRSCSVPGRGSPLAAGRRPAPLRVAAAGGHSRRGCRQRGCRPAARARPASRSARRDGCGLPSESRSPAGAAQGEERRAQVVGAAGDEKRLASFSFGPLLRGLAQRGCHALDSLRVRDLGDPAPRNLDHQVASGDLGLRAQPREWRDHPVAGGGAQTATTRPATGWRFR